MKKYLYVILLLALISIISCVQKKNTQQSTPDTAPANIYQGLEAQDQNKLNAASSYYSKAIDKCREDISKDPGNSARYFDWGSALNALAEMHKDTAQYKQAIEEYLKAIELDPKYMDSYILCANTLASLAELNHDTTLYEQAIQKYKQVIVLDSEYTNAYLYCGETMISLATLNKDATLYKQAIEKFQKVIELAPEYTNGYFNWGNALYSLAKLNNDAALYKQAIQKYKKTIEQDPEYTNAYYNISCIYSLQNKKHDAFEWLKKTLVLNKTTESLSHKEIMEDSDFNNIKNDKRFNSWLDLYCPSN